MLFRVLECTVFQGFSHVNQPPSVIHMVKIAEQHSKVNYTTAIVSYYKCLLFSLSETNVVITTTTPLINFATKLTMREAFVLLLYHLQDAKHMFAVVNTL